ncbi:MAG: biotin/lipoyl-containing protein, partial [Steroidobacteraceae bacterium]
MTYEILIDGNTYALELAPGAREAEWQCRVREPASAEFRELKFEAASSGKDALSLLLEGKSYEVRRDATPTAMQIWVGRRRYAVEVRDPRSLRRRRRATESEDGPRKLIAPMPGKVVRILAVEGTAVEAGQGLLVIEAMKMQNELKSPKKGVVRK